MGGKKKRTPIDPETRARWLEARRQLEAAVTRSRERATTLRAIEERRRARLRRWSLGLLGRP